jgi:midasin
MLGINHWTRIAIIPPTDDNLLEIVSNLLPRCQFIAPTVLQVYTSLREIYNHPTLKSSRNLTTRDLLKWTKRTAALCSNIQGQSIPRETWDDIFLEAIDCFAAMIPTSSTKRTIIERIGVQMGFPPERIRLYLDSHSPSLEDSSHTLRVGRMTIAKNPGVTRRTSRPFAYTSHAKKLLEQLAVAITHHEPLLLVGETGTGKTTIVQHLADLLHHQLVVVNVSQQTESSDLLGGFKPVDPRTPAVGLKEEFEVLFERTFSIKRNEAFLARIREVYSQQKWKPFVKFLRESISKAEMRFKASDEDGGAKKKRRVEGDLKAQWAKLSDQLNLFEMQLSASKGKSHAFSFVEGSLVKALRKGNWLLLDEINLAAADTLESISGLIREGGSITLPEKGELEAIKPHPDFRIFACMNPATDVGKRDLPPALRGQLTEIYVGSPDESIADLLLIVRQYIGHISVGDERAASDVAQLYLKIKSAAEAHDIVDGVGQKPHFSIRTLTRTLVYVADTAAMYGLRRALYEGLCMSFTTMLEKDSREKVVQMISEAIYPSARNIGSALRNVPKRPDGDYVQLGHYWIEKGSEAIQEDPQYIVKPGTSVEQNLHNLVRASLTRRYPILLQGPTSAGKTSMIRYLANLTGHKFLRINNHEHTSLDEYLGTYVSTPTGEFLFQEGILVQALRQGHWMVLDELNLAPSDVLEALNRLLDDNRELLIPETQEVIIPHRNFMLFATQNPAGLYGGRKVLSRAFRNRFLELEFEDIPEHELDEILCLRCQIPRSYGSKIVEVYKVHSGCFILMKQLSMHRQSTRLFEQRNSFATLRDLFRWAQREAVGYQQLAENGYMLLAERVRKEEEKSVVKRIIERVMKVRIHENALYTMAKLGQIASSDNIIWTKAMRRLFILVSQALVNNEPVLLVGETGCGKTTVCQVLAEQMGKKLHIVNAHQNTETGDIIGGQRPYRDRLLYQQRLINELREFFSDRLETTNMDLDELTEEFSKLNPVRTQQISSRSQSSSADIERIADILGRQKVLFEWVDGALVHAMKRGEPFLLDEISLADDSVLERLNSVLEPERSLVLAEKGGNEVNVIAADGFQFFSTMNPGGDYGKKELSPALRNRFTEIWVPTVDDHDDLKEIIRAQLKTGEDVSDVIVGFAAWYTSRRSGTDSSISIRDIIAWVNFVNATHLNLGINVSLFHGAMMVYVDGIGATTGTEFVNVQREKDTCVSYLSKILQVDFFFESHSQIQAAITSQALTLGRFSLPRASDVQTPYEFTFGAPTTASNGMKVLRAMQLPKAILLEGAPGIGKTTLVAALAEAAGQMLTRINLSDQTDLMDLFGSDVPVEGGRGGEFAWRDAPFLKAMQNGEWVLLDELNLASQSVLEGLNACLDHRGTVYIPELNRSFKRHPNSRIFAAQNPHTQGGGRKGLPKSFINRFSVVYLNTLTLDDMIVIGSHLYPEIDQEIRSKMIGYVVAIQRLVESNISFASSGRPWEFNLRDTLRWLELVYDQGGLSHGKSAAAYVDLMITQRLRTAADRKYVQNLFEELVSPLPNHPSISALGPETFQVGLAVTQRRAFTSCMYPTWNSPSMQQSTTMELLLLCVQRRWPCLLVGPSESSKTTSVRNLAAIVGASLKEVFMNNDTDATDIIGGYEQEDIYRHIAKVAEQIRRGIAVSLTESRDTANVAFYGNLMSLVLDLQNPNVDLKKFSKLLEAALQASHRFSPAIELVKDLQHLLQTAIKTTPTSRFRWYNGVLVDALLHGDWILLDNANLCNPSVLDRLNSLLEPNGSLVLHECTSADGTPKVIKPHPEFRLFLTMDAKHGELSRAMRNRVVEVSLSPALKTDVNRGIFASLGYFNRSAARPMLISLSEHAIYASSCPGRGGDYPRCGEFGYRSV